MASSWRRRISFTSSKASSACAPAFPTLVEKPVAHTLAEGIRLCEAAEAANVKLLVGHHRIHSPILHKACEVIGSGILGPYHRCHRQRRLLQAGLATSTTRRGAASPAAARS